MKGQYYVYVYLDPRKPGTFIYGDLSFSFEPFYVGKGTRDRYRQHLKNFNGDNRHKENKIKAIQRGGLEIPIVFPFYSSSSEEAYAEEARIITLIGRSCEGGILTNYHAGGKGGISPTPEIKQKISQSLKGRQIPEEQRQKLLAYWRDRPGTMKGRVGPLHPCYGRTGPLNPQYGRNGELSPVYGRKRPANEVERMRYNKLTFYSVVEDTFTGRTFNVYNISEFCGRQGLPRDTTLAGTYLSEKTVLYRGLKVVGRVPLPERWFDVPALLADYYQSLEIRIEGLATRDTSDSHVKNMKISFTKFRYVIEHGESVYEVYDVKDFCKHRRLDPASLYRTVTGEFSQHKGYAITLKEPLPKGWHKAPANRAKYFALQEQYSKAA